MAKTKHIIWSSLCNFSDWEEDLKSEYPECSEDELVDKMFEINSDYLYDERINLATEVDEEIIVIGNLGLWDGRRCGYKELNSKKISDCLYSDCDDAEWYVEGNDLKCDAYHHDGTNHYLYRYWKSGLSDSAKNRFLNRIYNGDVEHSDIVRFTRPIGTKVKSVYGWK